MKGFIAFLLILIVGGLGYVIWDKEMTKRHKLAAIEANITAIGEDQRRADERAHKIEGAILEGRVLVGMSQYEARKAWGRDYEVDKYNITPEEKRQGIYETWRYQDSNKGIVYLGVDGTVLEVRYYEGARQPASTSTISSSSRKSEPLSAIEKDLIGTYAVSGTPADFNVIALLKGDRTSVMLLKTGSKTSMATDGVWGADSSMLWISGSGMQLKFLRLDSRLKLISAGETALETEVILSKIPDGSSELAKR